MKVPLSFVLSGCALILPLTYAAVPTAAFPIQESTVAAAGTRDVVEPPRNGLQAVELPPPESLEPAVAEQIRAAARTLDAGARAQSGTRQLADAYGELAQILHAYEFFDSAEPAYGNAMRLAPTDVRWRYLLAYLFQQTGRLAEAAEAFEQVRRVEPARAAAAVRLGDVYLQLNRLREARQQFDEVLDVFPALARQGLGEIALRERRFEQAANHFRAVLDRVPTATTVHYSLAMAYRGLEQLDRAREHLLRRGNGTVRVADAVVDRLHGLIRGERGLITQGRRAYDAGQFEAAAEAFSRAVDAAPASATARVNLGLSLARLGKGADASAQLVTALRLEPDSVDAHAALGTVLADQGREEDALSHLRQAFERRPEDLPVRAGLLRVLVRLRRIDDAVAVLERVRALEPDDEETVVTLSILLAERQRFREAVTLLDESNRRFPDRGPTATTLARLLASSPDLALRDGARALELARSTYAAEPSAVHAETVALALAELGKCEEAAEWMHRAIAAADGQDGARLKEELPRYQTTSCRR
jgi:tetratricopeptide (TPR) repeat protein